MDKQQHISALYEIAMSIGTSLNLKESMQHTINTYIRQLDCAGISIFQHHNKEFHLQLSKPKNISNNPQHQIIMNKVFSSIEIIQKDYFSKDIPYILEQSNTYYYVCSLQEYGIMVIIKNNIPFIEKICKSIQPLHKKFSQAIRNCINNEKIILQDKQLLELNEHLEERVEKERLKNREKDKIMLAQSRQAAMGDMISMIAHQWRQPITAIGMGAQNMQLDIELQEIDLKRFDAKLNKIIDQTVFLSKTIDDFRNFLKPNKKPIKCTLCNIVEDTLTIIGKSIESNNIKLKKSYEKDIDITTFRNEVIQVLLNIINNAKDIITIKKMDDGVIYLKVSHDDEIAKFEICDNAGGIPDDVLPRIFEPYFSTKEESGGTGLGLYMSQMIVEKHLHGTITAHNTDKGACLNVSIPIKNNEGVLDDR